VLNLDDNVLNLEALTMFFLDVKAMGHYIWVLERERVYASYF